MPEPISNSSRFDPSLDWCSAELEEPAEAGAPPEGDQPITAPAAEPGDTRGGPVFSIGFTLSAESAFPTAASPVSDLPGGAAIAAGFYLDVASFEVGSYQRVEARWAAGSFAGAGVELGVTESRKSFEGESASVFAEGGKLGKFGFSANATGATVGVGVGEGVAAGLAIGETETDPGIQLDRLLEWGAPPLRRGP